MLTKVKAKLKSLMLKIRSKFKRLIRESLLDQEKDSLRDQEKDSQDDKFEANKNQLINKIRNLNKSIKRYNQEQGDASAETISTCFLYLYRSQHEARETADVFIISR